MVGWLSMVILHWLVLSCMSSSQIWRTGISFGISVRPTVNHHACLLIGWSIGGWLGGPQVDPIGALLTHLCQESLEGLMAKKILFFSVSKN